MGFSASLSGLNANQQKLSVIGNNLANINTVAFKSSSVQFTDLVSQSVGGSSANPMQIGLGVTTGAISPNFTQGGLENTGVNTHVAIQGRGFFVIGGGSNDRSYTRAGDFSFDANGRMVNSEGLAVQGYTAIDPVTGNLITTGQPSDIVVPPGVLRAPGATTMFGTVSNLNASAAVGDTFTASVQIYDVLGDVHVTTVTYTNTAPGAWSYDISVDGGDVTGGTAGTPVSIGAGNVTFSATGALTAPAADVVVTSPAWANGAAPTNFTWDLYDASGAAASLTGYAAPSATSSITQNGYAAGTITPISIDAEGRLQASMGTGRTVVIAQLAIASFNNPQGLVKLGSNRFGQSEASGIPNVGIATTGGRGSVFGSALEQSNVDIAQEFTQMILAQRGYQANSRSITVADELLVETLNLKR